jgi:hypothetical protein
LPNTKGTKQDEDRGMGDENAKKYKAEAKPEKTE